MIHFLIIFDHRIGKLISAERFDDADVAASAYSEAERNNKNNRDVEIVLVGADSFETIHHTHGQYFDESPLISKYLALPI